MELPHLWIALAWTAYFALHSLLAGHAMKGWVARRWPGAMPAYRLAFNALAVALLAGPVALMYRHAGDPVWTFTGPWAWIANGLALAALAGFAWSLRGYDMDEFWGLRQWRARERRVEDQERLRISSMHRHVRHPWYALALVLIWTRDMNEGFLVSALCISAYFVLGSRLEERKLIALHGEAYRRYRERVPALLPLPWKRLDEGEARRIEEGAHNARDT